MEWVKSKSYPQYTSNIPNYTTYDPYWIQNNLLFDIPFWIHNNLKTRIKYSALLFYCSRCYFLPFQRIGIMSCGSTKLENLSMICNIISLSLESYMASNRQESITPFWLLFAIYIIFTRKKGGKIWFTNNENDMIRNCLMGLWQKLWRKWRFVWIFVFLRPNRAKNSPKIQDFGLFSEREWTQGLLTGRKLCDLYGKFK